MWKFYSPKTIKRLCQEASENAVKAYQKQLADAPANYTEIDKLRSDCTAMLRFDNPHISIFSIERMEMNTRVERTIVGYVFVEDDKKKPTVREWTLYISRKQHNELVEQYAKNETTKSKEVQ